MGKKVLLSILSIIILSSCSSSTKKISNAEFDSYLKELSTIERVDQKIEYSNENGTFYTITQNRIREISFTGYKYDSKILGSKSNPFRIYLYPEVFFKGGNSFQRVILCPNRRECTDVTLAYLDPNRAFTSEPIPSSFYGLSLRDISALANRHAPAIQRIKFILQARTTGLKKLYMTTGDGVKIFTPKDRVNIVKRNADRLCYAWADNQESMRANSLRFNSCFLKGNFTSGDLADYDLKIKSISKNYGIDTFGVPVTLLTEKYKLSPYGRLYLSNYQGIESKYISSLNYQPVLPQENPD